MALISFVVPAYRVQGYLRECLDSILDQPFADVEVVAVDDCSPDSTGEIIAEYAARDHRVRAVTLDENVGLGEARNVGLDHATGEYVWFLDSDDWLADGCLPAVAERLRAAEPEVLIVDHVRVHWNNWTAGSAMWRAFPHPSAEVFSVRERPELIGVLHTAWNKVVRRRFLVDLGLRFSPGWYEDVSFSYPVLLAAERVGVLDLTCVNYRQRRAGAITRTRGDRHFEVFAQWRRVFELMASWGTGLDDLRPLIFERMIWHYLTVLGSGRRIPPELRRTFFLRIVDDYRRWLPPDGYRLPGGVEGVKHRLVASGSWRTFALLRAVHRYRGSLAGGAGRVHRASASPARRLGRITGLTGPRRVRIPDLSRQGRTGRRAGTLLTGLARVGRTGALRGYYQAQLRLPLDRSLALYAAYWYRGYSCNPAAIYEKARELAPGIRGVWVVRRDLAASLPDGVPYVVAGTRPYYRALARARWLINNVNFPDFVVKRRGSVHIQTHHGTPVKVMGLDQQRYPRGAVGLSFRKLLRRIDRWDYSVSANTFSTQMWERAYPAGYQSLQTGYPRNDRLLTAPADEIAAIRDRLGAGPGDRVVLYAPTHREHLPGYRPPLDAAALVTALGPAGRLLIRGHYFDAATTVDRGSAGGASGGVGERVTDVTGYGSVEDLYLAADVLITDYSSAMFDYATLDRPIVIYAPDWAEYRRDRGVYLDVLAEPPGAVTTSFAGLLDLFRTGAVDGAEAARARSRFRRRFCALDDGHAAERVVRRALLGEPG